MTIVAQLQSVLEELQSRRVDAGSPTHDAAREFSIAITHVEDAIMRVNRGVAKMHGKFSVADCQQIFE